MKRLFQFPVLPLPTVCVRESLPWMYDPWAGEAIWSEHPSYSCDLHSSVQTQDAHQAGPFGVPAESHRVATSLMSPQELKGSLRLGWCAGLRLWRGNELWGQKAGLYTETSKSTDTESAALLPTSRIGLREAWLCFSWISQRVVIHFEYSSGSSLSLKPVSRV